MIDFPTFYKVIKICDLIFALLYSKDLHFYEGSILIGLNLLQMVAHFFFFFFQSIPLLDLSQLKTPLPHPRRNFVHYNFLKLHYMRNKMTHVSRLAMGAFTCNSHVTNVTLKTIKKTLIVNTKVSIIFLNSMLFATYACGFHSDRHLNMSNCQ